MLPPIISVIVCTHNRERFLRSCLKSLYQQTLSQEKYEVLVVDNASTDGTKAVCEEYLSFANFRYIFEAIPGLSQARNTGWQNGQGRYIAFIDDDATAVPDWLEKILVSFQASEPEPDWVGGPVNLVWEKEPPAWLTREYFNALGWVDWGTEARLLDPQREWLVGCNCILKRDTLEKFGGFDTRLGRKKNLLLSGEEVQLHHRIQAAGGSFYYHPEVRVNHHVAAFRVEPGYFYRRYYWGGITDFIMAKTLHDVPSQNRVEQPEQSQGARLTKNFFLSTGLFSSYDRAVASRIYMAYVAGWVRAAIRYRWEDFFGLKGANESYGS